MKLRIKRADHLPPVLLFLALNSEPVQRQIRSVQFTADIIDTIGQRFFELYIPIPRNPARQAKLVQSAQAALITRARAKAFIKHTPRMMEICLASGSSDEIERFLALRA